MTDVHDEVDQRVSQTADVIGVTTTGLAKRIAALQNMPCKILICEEAGEGKHLLVLNIASCVLPGALLSYVFCLHYNTRLVSDSADFHISQ